MPNEIELKLTLQPKDLRRLLALPWVHSLAKGRAATKTIISIYYDTETCALRDKGISLRVRRIGNKRLQTIKTAGSGAPFARKEWEMEISGDRPDFGRMRGTALEPLLDKKLKRTLAPVFETRVRRTSFLAKFGGGEVEVAVDQGAIKCCGQSRPISEVELELKAGDPRAVCKMAARLSRALPVAYGAKTKPERGYALLDDRYDKPAWSEAIVLRKHADTASSFQTIGLSCLLQLARNEGAVRKHDREGIHQMRVGLRRLRAAISIFKGILEDRQSEDIKAELRWFTEQLAPARDYDVFLEDSVEPMQAAQPRCRQMAAFRAVLLRERVAGLAKAKDAVASERYRRLVLRTALWLADGNWCRYRDNVRRRQRARPAKALACESLTRRTRKIVKKMKNVEELDAGHRHKLRIAIKKLRYATEFFDSLFTGAEKDRKAFSKALEKLQTAMGELNDIRVHVSLADKIVDGQRSARGHTASLAADFVKKQDRRKIKPLLKAAEKASAHLGKLKPFWK